MKNKIKTLFYSLAATGLFLPTIALASLDWSISIGSDGSSGGFSVGQDYGLPDGTILGIVENLLFWLLSLFGIVGIIGFVISGIIYLVAAGDNDLITKAKAAMKWSIVGIIVGLSGFIALQAINAWLGGRDDF